MGYMYAMHIYLQLVDCFYGIYLQLVDFFNGKCR